MAGQNAHGKYLPTGYQDLTVLMELSAPTWRLIVDAAGESARLSGETLTHENLLESLNSQAPGENLFDALEVVCELGTDKGRDLLHGASDDQQVDLKTNDDESSRDLAARLWLESRKSSGVLSVLNMARVHLRDAPHDRSYREYAGKRAISRAIDREQLKTAVSQWCEKNGKSEAVDVYIKERNGEWICQILRGDPIKQVTQILEERPAPLKYRPAVSDCVRYDPSTGRLSIATRSPRLNQMYREVLGSLISSDSDFFGGENVCSLKPLQEKGAGLFEGHAIPGIQRVDVSEIHWRRGDRDKIWVRGRNCFQILDDLGARLNEGELVEARLSIMFAGSGRPGTVWLKAPNRIEIRVGAHESLVEWLLDEVGIRGSFGDEQEKRDLWALYPWRFPEERWRQILPQDFDRLVREQVIRAVSLETVSHPDHPAAPGTLTVAAADTSLIVGLSTDPAIADRTLTPSDVTGYELDIARITGNMAKTLQLDGIPRELSSGLWSLGRRELTASATISVLLATRQPDQATSAIIQSASAGANAVLLIPNDCTCSTAVPTVPCRVAVGPYTSLIGSIVERLGLQNVVPPRVWAIEDLILDCSRSTAWFHDVELTTLQANTHAFKFAVMVVRANGQLVATNTINAELSTRDDQEAAKKAKLAFTKAVKSSFAAVNRPCPPEVASIFEGRSGGYTLKASGRVFS
jgi:hypothetical protein